MFGLGQLTTSQLTCVVSIATVRVRVFSFLRVSI